MHGPKCQSACQMLHRKRIETSLKRQHCDYSQLFCTPKPRSCRRGISTKTSISNRFSKQAMRPYSVCKESPEIRYTCIISLKISQISDYLESFKMLILGFSTLKVSTFKFACLQILFKKSRVKSFKIQVCLLWKSTKFKFAHFWNGLISNP